MPDPSGRQTIEGDGSRINPYAQLLSEVVRYLVSSCRVVQCVKESNGNRLGTSGQKIGTVHWRWACAAAARRIRLPS